MNGRDFQQLQLLTPGSVSTTNFQTNAGLAGGASGSAMSQKLNVSNGSRPGSQLFLLDGGFASSRKTRTLVVPPAIDEIEEFRVAGSNFSAEYGYGTNVVSVSTRSGTNQFHGGLWEFLRTDAVAARSFFARTVPILKRNQLGGGLGGRLIKDRTFFYVTYEGQRQRTSNPVQASVPTARMRTGDLTEWPNQIFDPATSRRNVQGVVQRDPFPGKIIPGARIDPVASMFLDEWIPHSHAPGISDKATLFCKLSAS